MRKGLGWPLAMAAILAVTVGGNLWVMRIASADPSFAIEPDYYAKAVRWDSTMAQERRNHALGWTVTPELGAIDPRRGATLRVVVTAPDGARISDATVRVVAFAVARSARRVDVALAPADGTYGALVPVTHAGAWELRLDVRRGADRMVVTRRVEAVAAPGQASAGP